MILTDSIIILRVEEVNSRGVHFRVVGDAYKFRSTAEADMNKIKLALHCDDDKDTVSNKMYKAMANNVNIDDWPWDGGSFDSKKFIEIYKRGLQK